MIDLTDKTAFITGASRGIGEATARKLASYGAKVVLAARNRADIERIAGEIGPGALALPCDVTSYEAVTSAIEETRRRFGGLDILVNNAGTIDPISRIESSDPAAWGQVVDINLKGVYHCLQAAYPALKETRRRRDQYLFGRRDQRAGGLEPLLRDQGRRFVPDPLRP